jgi:hypothetical protein
MNDTQREVIKRGKGMICKDGRYYCGKCGCAMMDEMERRGTTVAVIWTCPNCEEAKAQQEKSK